MIVDKLSLPAEVRERLAIAGVVPGLTVVARARLVEDRRSVAPVEVRADEATGLTLGGYASTFDTPYDVAGGAERGGWSEVIAPGAFTKALRENDDVRLLVNHEGLPIARTRSGTLLLEQDDLGLRVLAEGLDESNPTVAEVRSALARGDVDQMSFAFLATRQEWARDYSERRITEVRLFDVSVVTYPANDATIVGLRSDPPAAERPALPLALALAQAEALSL